MSFVQRVRVVLGTALMGLVLFSPSVLDAQTTSAVVSGSVKDSQGGALPGATVTLTSRTQGNVLTATTDAEGRYVFSIVRPDSYTLRVTMQGFKTLERTNVVVNANDTLLGAARSRSRSAGSRRASPSSSRVSELQVESGERSFTLESEALTNIADNGRAMFNFANLVPGVLQQGTRGTEAAPVSAFTVERPAPELEQHHGRRRHQHRHR